MFNTLSMFWKRIKMSLDYAKEQFGMSQESVADEVKRLSGVKTFSQQSLSKLVKSKAEGSKFAAYIAKACHRNPLWLALGEPYPMEEEKELTEEAKQLAHEIEGMPSENRQYLHGYIKANKG